MATSGIINGTDFRLYIGGQPVGYASSASLSVSRELRESIHKDLPSSGWRQVNVGQKSATVNCDAFYNSDAATALDAASKTPDDIFTAMAAGTRVYCAMKGASGDDRFTFYGYITQFEANFPAEEDSSYSLTIEVDGALTLGNVT